jgi:hypothetical protein
VPGVTIVTRVSLTVQTPGVVEAKLTGSREDAVALMENGTIPKVTLFSAPNVMICDAGLVGFGPPGSGTVGTTASEALLVMPV